MLVHVKNSPLTWETLTYEINKRKAMSEHSTFLVIDRTRMVVHGQLVEPAVCFSDLYDVFLLDIIRDTRQNLWTIVYRSQ